MPFDVFMMCGYKDSLLVWFGKEEDLFLCFLCWCALDFLRSSLLHRFLGSCLLLGYSLLFRLRRWLLRLLCSRLFLRWSLLLWLLWCFLGSWFLGSHLLLLWCLWRLLCFWSKTESTSVGSVSDQHTRSEGALDSHSQVDVGVVTNFVVLRYVFSDGLTRRSTSLLQRNDGCLDHVLVGRVSSNFLRSRSSLLRGTSFLGRALGPDRTFLRRASLFSRTLSWTSSRACSALRATAATAATTANRSRHGWVEISVDSGRTCKQIDNK